MYIYNKEDEVFIFDGDLEQYLLDKGVEVEHIERMKTKILQQNKEYYYDSHLNDKRLYKKEVQLVPLAKVIGTCRATVGKSVFENVNIIPDGEREPSSFKRCFSYIDKMNLEELRDSYENLVNPVEMVYYKEEDEYYLINDGNHRTLTAMLVGAKNIRANVTTKYCDFEKRDKWFAVENFYKDFNIIQINYAYIEMEIVFKDNDDYFVVEGFPIKINENCYEYINKLSNEIQGDMKLAKIWTRLPKIIRTILHMFSNNKRIIQYINKSQNAHWDGRMNICDFD